MSTSPKSRVPVEVQVLHFKWDHGRGVSFSAPHCHQPLLRRLVAARFQQAVDEGQRCVKTGAHNIVWKDGSTGEVRNKLCLRVTWGEARYDPEIHGILSFVKSTEYHDPA